ncbi:putative transcription factor interactor and regulator CCHC(Zn) family [Helianthus anomalus]
MNALDLNQIHPEVVEEMDITWQLTMSAFRASNFVAKTGRNNWVKGRMGPPKANLRCYKCHEPGHFARDFKKTTA